VSDAINVSVSNKKCTQVEQDLVSSIFQALNNIVATDNKILTDTFYNDNETNTLLSSSNSLDIVDFTCLSSFIITTPSSNPTSKQSLTQTIHSIVDSVSHPNNEITAKNFRFKSNGKKGLKK
jgi:hypothetical protein